MPGDLAAMGYDRETPHPLTGTARARSVGSEVGAAFWMTVREMDSGALAKLVLIALEESSDPAGALEEVEVAASLSRDAVAALLSRDQEAGEVRGRNLGRGRRVDQRAVPSLW